MRIAIINLTGGGMSGGYRKYILNMLPRLAANARIESILCASPAAMRVQDWFPVMPKVRYADCGTFRFGRHSPAPAFGKELRDFSPDVLFVPAARWLKFGKVPTVTVVLNMGPLVPMSGVGPWEALRRAAQCVETKLAVRKADKVVAVSGFVKEYLVRRWRLSPDKIAVIHFGANPAEEVISKPPALFQDASDKFIFTAGSIERYRGVEDLLGAFKELAARGRMTARLVIAGSARKEMASYFAQLKRRALELGLGSSIRWAEDLSDAEMAWCYAHCSAFVMTSRIEACPNVALEAIAQGCQCIAADNPPLPEIFGDEALYYRPGDAQGLAAAIEVVTRRSASEKQDARRRTLERARQFSWEGLAEKTVHVLSQAIEHGTGRA